MLQTTTVDDCTLNGEAILLANWPQLCSDQLSLIVGAQQPGGEIEYANEYDWRFAVLPTDTLRFVTDCGEEPDGGWSAAYLRHAESDRQACLTGSPEYAGRAEWLRDHWIKNTAIYPLFLVECECGGYRLWDGHRRLAGAFFYGLKEVAAIVGRREKS